MRDPLIVSHDLLTCPRCGDTSGTHIDTVVVAAASGHSITVTASGEDELSTVRVVEADNATAQGRRHEVRLLVDCELCGGSAIVLRQHKGTTQVELA